MSRDSAKAHYTKQPGDPDEGFITASDAQAAIDDIYDDMSAPAVIADGSVTSGKIAADAVGSAQIATGAVGSGELATDAVTSDKIADGAVSNAHVASDAAIAASKVAGTAVTQADTGTVTNGMLAGSIAKTKVAGTAITAADTGTVTGTMIAAGAVDNGNLAANAVNEAKIASGAVTTVKIADDAVTSDKIADNAVTAAQIAANAVGASELADNAVDTAAIAADAVTADKIAADAVGSSEIAAGAVGTAEIADAAVTVAKLGSDVRIGNLLTANQASGGDTLGSVAGWLGYNCTVSRETGTYLQGNGCLKAVVTAAAWPTVYTNTGTSGVPVVWNDATYTMSLFVLASVGTPTVIPAIEWFDSGGSSLGQTNGASFTSNGTWQRVSVSVKPPTYAAFASPRFVVAGSVSDAILADCLSFHRGASGQWAMPGTPIVHTGIRPNPSNTAEVQIWNDATATWITV